EDDGVTGGDFHGAEEGALRAEVPGVLDGNDVAVSCRDVLERLVGIVRAGVVHEDDLLVDVDRGEGLGQASVHDRNGLVVLVAGDGEGDAGRFVGRGESREGREKGGDAAVKGRLGEGRGTAEWGVPSGGVIPVSGSFRSSGSTSGGGWPAANGSRRARPRPRQSSAPARSSSGSADRSGRRARVRRWYRSR